MNVEVDFVLVRPLKGEISRDSFTFPPSGLRGIARSGLTIALGLLAAPGISEPNPPRPCPNAWGGYFFYRICYLTGGLLGI